MKIAVITSGGDAPGMNACIRAVVRYALSQNIEVCGFKRGYQGILDNDVVDLDRTSVSDTIQRGGTFLKSDRCEKFLQKEYRLQAGKVLQRNGCDGLIVIGGDGSFAGANALAQDTGTKVVGIPGTIDNDLAYTDFTLGFDTAVNNVLWAINNLRDTMQSHDKVTIVEVMGRHCGDIALHSCIAGGAEFAFVPEVETDVKEIAEKIKHSAEIGKKSNLIVLAEGAGKMEDVAKEFEKYSGITPRQTRLGFIQRGGSPTYQDRLLACKFAIEAVKLLQKGESNKVVGVTDGKVVATDIDKALAMKKRFDKELYDYICHLA